MTVRKLADQAGITNPYLSQIERGLRKPTAEILMSIARAIDFLTESLYDRAGLLDVVERSGVEEAISSDSIITRSQKQALAEMSRTQVNARWQTEMAPFFESLDGRRPDEEMLPLEEVFHLE